MTDKKLDDELTRREALSDLHDHFSRIGHYQSKQHLMNYVTMLERKERKKDE